jgi:hypothetical protein
VAAGEDQAQPIIGTAPPRLTGAAVGQQLRPARGARRATLAAERRSPGCAPVVMIQPAGLGGTP